MPSNPIIRHKIVYHIGHLDRPQSERKPTLDGPMVAVSTQPEDWRAIAGLNGPEYRMEFQPAQWLDVLAMTKEDIDEVIAWMLERDYMRAGPVYQTNLFNEETGDFEERTFVDMGAAVAHVAQSCPHIADPELAVIEEDGYQLKPRGLARLGGVAHWPDRLRWFDGAMQLYLREVLAPKRGHVVGLWWSEPRDTDQGLSGYGLMLPERAHLFEVEDEETGESKPFHEAFPECPGVLHPEDLAKIRDNDQKFYATMMGAFAETAHPRRH